MEFEEIKKHWKTEDQYIQKSIKTDKSISHKRLRISFNRIKMKKIILLLLPLIYLPLLFILIILPGLKNDGSLGFYTSLIFFSATIVVSFAVNVYSYIRLYKIDHTQSVIHMQKKILSLEIFDKKWHITAYCLVPFLFLALLKMFGRLIFNQTTVIFIVLLSIAVLIGYIVKIKIMLPREYRKIKSFLEEIDNRE